MKLKKLLAAVLPALLLFGCVAPAEEDEETVFQVSDEDGAYYASVIEETLNSFYWRYDSGSIFYEEDVIPDNEEILTCSQNDGYDLERYVGDNCIKASASLLYFNRQPAGTVYFYFVGQKLAGLYYTPFSGGIPCSLDVRNAYMLPGSFTNMESADPVFEYNASYIGETSVTGMFDSTVIDGTSYSIFTDGRILSIYRGNGSSAISLYKTVDLTEEGLIPMSAAFINRTTESAVLYGIETYSDEGSSHIIVPQKIIFFDSDFNATESEISSTENDLYSVGFDDGNLVMSRGKYIDYYSLSGTSPGVTLASYYIGRSISAMRICDLDGDGQTEYIFTDGLDLFIYHRTDTLFRCVWSTHLSIDSFEDFIYAGDLNGDGVKEIYVIDSSSTAAKYAIGEKGMYIDNEDITYGQSLHIADFNGDGLSDCLVSYGQDADSMEMRLSVEKS